MDKKELKFFSLRSVMILLYIVVVAIIPLALRARIVEYNSPVETWHRLASKTIPEVFAQFRLELLLITTVLIVLAALLKLYYEYDKHGITGSYMDYPAAVFAFLVVLSGLFSPYVNLAFWGYYNRGEGSFAYLCYIFIFIVAAIFINAEKDKKIIFYAALAAGLVQSMLAITQFFGFDLMKSDLAIRLFVPAAILPYVEDIQFMFTNKAYGTTFNPNYMGGYMAMIFPVVFVMYLYSRTAREKAVWLVALLISLAGFFAPTSIGAFASGGLALLVFFMLTAKDIKSYYKNLVSVLLIVAVVAGVSEVLSGGMISRKVSNFTERTLETISDSGLRKEQSGDFTAEEKKEEIPAPGVPAGGTINIEIHRNPYDELGNGRYYIWRKSLEVIKNNFLIGTGLDTFLYNFPNWDPGRYTRIGVLVDKPHNTYLQIAMGAGVPALLVYLYILILHFKNYLRVFRRRGLQEESDIIMLALFVGWLGYLFQGLGNDSVLSNAPVFWALFGLSVNYVKNALVEIEEKKKSRAVDGKHLKEADLKKARQQGAKHIKKKK